MYYQNTLQGGHFSQTPYPQKDHFTVYPQKFVAIFSKVIFISYPHLCLPLRHLYACLLPPVLVRNRSSWRAASVAGAKLYFLCKDNFFLYFCAIVCARPGGSAGHKLLAVF